MQRPLAPPSSFVSLSLMLVGNPEIVDEASHSNWRAWEPDVKKSEQSSRAQ